MTTPKGDDVTIFPPGAPPPPETDVAFKDALRVLFGRLMNADPNLVKEKLDNPDVDPEVKEALEAGAASNTGALESAIGCAEGSQPGSSIKTACPGVGSGKPQVVKRQWNMGFPPQEGAAAQAGASRRSR